MTTADKHSFKPIVTLSVLGKELNVYGTISEPVFITWDVGELLNHQDYDNSISYQKVAESEIMDGSYFYRGEYLQVKVLTEDGLTMFMYHSSNPEAVSYLREIRIKINELKAREHDYTDNGETIINLNKLLESERNKNAQILQEQIQLKKDYIQLNKESIQLHERIKMLLENIGYLIGTAKVVQQEMDELEANKNASSLFKRGGLDA